jgi:2,4-dienoyl-CoA reductase-like NADH-dependent reductase (Old Yellow Enzyme family)
VAAEGRITPQDSGLWKDSQIEPLKRIVDFAHSQGQKIGIQLAHAGRKASTVAPWIDRKAAASAEVCPSPFQGIHLSDESNLQVGGWPDKVISASDTPYDENLCIPRKMTLEDISNFKKSFLGSVHWALKAGVDVCIIRKISSLCL